MSTYDAIATEYFDVRHRTCRNFDAATKQLLSDEHRIAQEIFTPIVEFGPGRGRCYEYLHKFAQAHVDSSYEMLKLEPREPGVPVHADATDTPFVSGYFGSAVAFLCDPYISQDWLDEVHRITCDKCRLLFTTPSYEWGTALRGGEIHETKFVTQNGETVTVPSNLLTMLEIEALLSRCHFKATRMVYAYLPKNVEPSDAVTAAAQNRGVDVYGMPLVYLVSAVKS